MADECDETLLCRQSLRTSDRDAGVTTRPQDQLQFALGPKPVVLQVTD